ncbi:hypothetical protein ACO2K5_19415, partial [Leptospira interrogans]
MLTIFLSRLSNLLSPKFNDTYSSSTQSNSVPSVLLQCLAFIIRLLYYFGEVSFKNLILSDICG